MDVHGHLPCGADEQGAQRQDHARQETCPTGEESRAEPPCEQDQKSCGNCYGQPRCELVNAKDMEGNGGLPERKRGLVEKDLPVHPGRDKIARQVDLAGGLDIEALVEVEEAYCTEPKEEAEEADTGKN